MEKLLEAIAERGWIIDAFAALILVFLIVMLIFLAMRMINKHLHEFFHYLKEEAKELMQMKPSLGAINFGMVILLLLFGVLVVIGIETQKIVGFIASYVGATKADIFAKSADFNTLFYVLAAVAVVSVLSVAVDSRKG